MSATATGMTQLTAPNQTVEAPNGVGYAYRRLGEPSASAPPLVSFQHFRGNLDNWDPALVDALARTREVILFDNAGVGGSTGTVPRTVTTMAHDALSFIDALELREIDVLGYSLGGFVAQELVLVRPRLVRRLVLAGTGPQGGDDLHGFTDEMFVHANRDQPGADDILALFFERSETSLAKGREFLQRIFTRTEDRDTRATLLARAASLSGRGRHQSSQQERSTVMTGKNWRELDYRQAEGGRLRVRLLWNERSHNLAVQVTDRGVERVLALRDPALARNAFMHPFAYMR